MRWRRKWTAILAPCFLLATLLPAAVQAASPPHEDSTATKGYNKRGFAQLNECLGTHDRVDALYVMDVSGSLVQNDQSGSRFDALEASVAQLGLLASSESARAIEVYAAVSTFGDAYSGPAKVQDWTQISSATADGTADQFRSAAEEAWAQAGTSQGTNYQAAVAGALGSLKARGSRANACQVVLWFTDGLFALGDTYDVAATNAASREMCSIGGLIDEVRDSQVSLVALALAGPDVQAQLARPEYRDRRGELQAMAVGRSGERRCGMYPIPEESRSGIYLSANDPTALGALFSGVAAQASGCVAETVPSRLPVEIDVAAGVGRFQLDVSLEDAPQQVTLTAPDGTSDVVPTGRSKFGAGTVELRTTGSLTSVTVTMPTASMRGEWRVAMDESRAPVSVTLYRCSDLQLDILNPEEGLRAGEEATVQAVVRDSSGSAADLREYRGDQPDQPPDILVEADSAGDVSARFDDLATGTMSVSFTPDEDTLTTRITLTFTPRLNDENGTQLSPVSGSRSFDVTPPGSFPTITPADVLDLGATDGLDAAVGELTVHGSDQGATRVCFGSATGLEVPIEAGRVEVATDGDECRDLEPGGSTTVTVSAAPGQSAEGFGSAQLPVTLTSVDGNAIRHDLGLEWSFERKVDQGRRLGLLIAALVIAIAIPLLALALVNRWLARFEKGDVRHATTDIDVHPDGSFEPASPFRTADLEATYVDDSRRRRLQLGDSGLEYLARAPWNPLGSPRFQARAQHGRLVSGNGDVQGDGHSVEVSAGLNGLWLLAFSDDALRAAEAEEPVRGRLTIITRGEGIDEISRLVEKSRVVLADGRWEGIRSDLISAAGTATTGAKEPIGHGVASAPSGETAGDPFGLDVSHETPHVSAQEDDPFGFVVETSEPPPSRREARRRRRGRSDEEATASGAEEEWEDPFQ